MKLQVLIVLILFLCGCASTQQKEGAAARSASAKSKLSRQERIIQDACIKSRNIFYWSEDQLRKEELTFPNHPVIPLKDAEFD